MTQTAAKKVTELSQGEIFKLGDAFRTAGDADPDTLDSAIVQGIYADLSRADTLSHVGRFNADRQKADAREETIQRIAQKALGFGLTI